MEHCGDCGSSVSSGEVRGLVMRHAILYALNVGQNDR